MMIRRAGIGVEIQECGEAARARLAGPLALIIVGLAVGAAGLGLAGCASASKPVSTSYVQDYEAKRYQQAYDNAKSAAPSLKGLAKDQALLIQGESAHAINKNAESKQILRPLIDHRDPRIAGQAAATLGLVYQEEGNFQEAAQLLTSASEKLDGDAAARSALYAGDCRKSLGQAAEAKAMYQRADGLVRTDNALRGMIADRLSAGGPVGVGQFTLQAGAYSTRQRAQAQADRLRQKVDNLGLGPPRVVEIQSKGKTLHSVRIGRFTSKEAAQKAASGIGAEAVVTKAE